jgi:hypothetical protein
MGLLDTATQIKMEGKIVSYFHSVYQSFVYLGCTPENQTRLPKGTKAFNPEEIPGCINAWGQEREINLQNLIS